MTTGHAARRRFIGRIVRCAGFLGANFLVGVSVQAQLQLQEPVAPGPVTLELRLGSGGTQFHLGEVIPVQLIFSSQERREYTVGEDCLPRQYERYNVVPPELVDRSLETDAALQLNMGNCHGFQSRVDPGAQPLVVRQVLNTWFRIDKPGKYRISVTSKRLGFSLTSIPIELEILPSDPVWEDFELKRALSLIDAPRSRGSAGWGEGCRVVRFLGTQASEIEMARHVVGPSRCDFETALVNVKNRAPVLAQLERGLTGPDTAIEVPYLRATSLVSLYTQHPDWYPQPENPPEMSDFPMNSVLWRARGTLQNEEIRYARILAVSLSAKSPEAQATSLDALLHLGRSLGNVDLPPDLFAAMRDQMPGLFPKLPWDARQYVLLYEWDEFQGPAMTAVLDKMVNQEHWLGTNGIALRRLSELSPDKARGAFLDLLKAPTVPAFAGIVQDKEELLDTLGQLPDRELPELDAVSLQRLRPLQDGLSQVWTGILERYSTAAIAQPVRDWFEDHLGKMQCAVQANLVAYFLRVDAKDGSEKLRQAAQANPPDCRFLENLARVRMSPEVEQAALAALDDPQPSAVVDALGALAAYGSPAAKEPILRHFQQWHGTWAARVDELEAPAGKQQVDVESAYLGAISRAQGWLPSDSDWQSAASWCVSSRCKQNVPSLRHPWGSPKFDYWIEILDPGHDFVFRQHVHMGNPAPWTIERLREKMLQFPKGYAFQIDTRNQEPHVIQHYYNELKPWAESHGYELHLSDGTV